MCGRFTLSQPAAVQARFGFVDWHERRIERRFNIAPSQDILTIVQHPGSPPVAQEPRWGPAPHWLQSGDVALAKRDGELELEDLVPGWRMLLRELWALSNG